MTASTPRLRRLLVGMVALCGVVTFGLQGGDHLHPNDAGMQAMADAIPLRLFESASAG